MKQEVHVRLAQINDSLDILSWRNDPVTRSMSRSANITTQEEHNRWIRSVLEDESKFLFICEQAGVYKNKLAMLRFDTDDKTQSAEVSINVNPQFRGMSFGRPCLVSAIAYFATSSTTTKVFAYIAQRNNASKKLFQRAGFKLISQPDSDFLKYSYRLKRETSSDKN